MSITKVFDTAREAIERICRFVSGRADFVWCRIVLKLCARNKMSKMARELSFETEVTLLVGYMRVSTAEQSLDLQRDALQKNGCEMLFEDVGSGALDTRKGLQECLAYLREGDTLVVWKLDRLGRSLNHLVATIGTLHEKKIGFKSLSESIDTTTDTGKLVFHIFASLAEFERALIRERTNAGLKAARARGRTGGRPSLLDAKSLAMAQTLLADEKNTVDDICRTLKVSRSTLYRSLRKKRY